MGPRAWSKRYAVEALVVVLAVAGQVEIWVAGVGGPSFAAVVAALAGTLPLLARRRLPFAAPACVFAGVAVMSLASPAAVADGTSATVFSLILAFWAVGAHGDRQQVVAGAAIGLAALAVIAQSGGRAVEVQIGDFELDAFTFSIIGVGLPLATFALRRRGERATALQERAERLESERDERARAAVAAERARIARDLHDVIAHSVSVMTVQGGAARLMLDEDAQRAREPLLVVERTGRQALTEMRRLLGSCTSRTPRRRSRHSPGWPTSTSSPTRCAARACPSSWSCKVSRSPWHPVSSWPPSASCRRR